MTTVEIHSFKGHSIGGGATIGIVENGWVKLEDIMSFRDYVAEIPYFNIVQVNIYLFPIYSNLIAGIPSVYFLPFTSVNSVQFIQPFAVGSAAV